MQTAYRAAPPPDAIGFCEARDTMDDPGAAYSPSDHRAGRLPEQTAAVEGASTWRCAGREPVALGTPPLDARKSFKVAWVEYAIGADGFPRPIAFSDGVR